MKNLDYSIKLPESNMQETIGLNETSKQNNFYSQQDIDAIKAMSTSELLSELRKYYLEENASGNEENFEKYLLLRETLNSRRNK